MGKAVVIGKTVLNTRFTSAVAAAVVEAAEVPAAEVQEDHLVAAAEVPHQAAVAPAAPAAAALAASVRSPASRAADTTPVVLQNLTGPASQVPEELPPSL